jgi:hypothetical protein
MEKHMPNYLRSCLKYSSYRNLFRGLSLLYTMAAAILLCWRTLQLHARGIKLMSYPGIAAEERPLLEAATKQCNEERDWEQSLCDSAL